MSRARVETRKKTVHERVHDAVLCFAGTACAGVAIAGLMSYHHTPGATAAPPAASIANVPVDPDRMTLIMAIHPKCPCTRTALAELERLQARCTDRLACRLYFYRPSNKSENWGQSDFWRIARGLPDTQLIDDPDGIIAERLGAYTSSSVVLYKPDGTAVFHGGITGTRGHQGGSAGSDAIVQLIADRTPVLDTTPVYGCPIVKDPEQSKCTTTEQ